MTELERMKMNLELKRVELARLDMETKIAEFKEEIKRLTGYIEVQLKKEQELQDKLK